MGRNTVMALLLCLSFLVLSLLGLPMTTEARMRVAFSSSSDIDDDHYFPPPTDVGLVQPADYAGNMCRPRLEVAASATGGPTVARNLPTGEAERVLKQVERNFTALTRTVPMAETEDLPPSMQPHVVGAPRAWVQLFRHLSHDVDYYNRAIRP
uniref:Uncharacterized protein n=1 Tax=Picea sitchensis TaxID=3332 RepID=A9NY46_PICSI|nr:unknown [Picea sitchensis]